MFSVLNPLLSFSLYCLIVQGIGREENMQTRGMRQREHNFNKLNNLCYQLLLLTGVSLVTMGKYKHI